MQIQKCLGLLHNYHGAILEKDFKIAMALNQGIYETEFERYLGLTRRKRLFERNNSEKGLIEKISLKIGVSVERLNELLKHAVFFTYAQQNNQEDK